MEMSIEFAITLGKIGLVLAMLLSVTPVMAWVERRGSALIQDRPGPNRVGPFGIFQALADAVKFFLKEDIIPARADKMLYVLAPLMALLPALTTFAVIPFGQNFVMPSWVPLCGGRLIRPIVADVNIGLLVVFALASLEVYGVVIAGWSSNSKFSVMGGLRAAAQMISYELAISLSVIGILMQTGSLRLTETVAWQATHVWNVVPQFFGFVIFLVAGFAETNRLPFDLPEADSELVAGYHTEYSSMKFALFFMAEYIHMATFAALIVTLFLGGWTLPGVTLTGAWGGLVSMAVFVAKMMFFLWLFVWVRWTLPRFRYDQLLRLGWKIFLPLGFFNLVLTAALIAWKVL